MATAILNSDGLEISSRIKFLKTHRYEVYGEVKEIEGEGVIVDLDFLVDDFGARDDKGTLWTTPCPSAVGEWSAGVEVAMKDLLILNRGNPLKIWVPGCARPLFCKNSDVINSYYFACGCENCSSDADIETIRLILEQLSVTKTSDMGEMLKFSDAFQDLVNRRKKLVKKFDVKMKQVVQKHFPKAEVCLYTRITAPFLPGSFDVKDFRLAPVLFKNARDVLMMLPMGDPGDSFNMSQFSPEITDYMALKILEDVEVRNVAERYINSALVPEVA
jgi:hypothetical protein